MNQDVVKKRFQHAMETEKQDYEEFFLLKFFGLEVTFHEENNEQICRVDFEVSDYMYNPQGSLHGGVITFILDVAMGHLCKKFHDPAVTLELKTQYHRAIFEEKGYCEARFLKKGGKVTAIESKMYNSQGKLAASATSTFFMI